MPGEKRNGLKPKEGQGFIDDGRPEDFSEIMGDIGISGGSKKVKAFRLKKQRKGRGMSEYNPGCTKNLRKSWGWKGGGERETLVEEEKNQKGKEKKTSWGKTLGLGLKGGKDEERKKKKKNTKKIFTKGCPAPGLRRERKCEKVGKKVSGAADSGGKYTEGEKMEKTNEALSKKTKKRRRGGLGMGDKKNGRTVQKDRQGPKCVNMKKYSVKKNQTLKRGEHIKEDTENPEGMGKRQEDSEKNNWGWEGGF